MFIPESLRDKNGRTQWKIYRKFSNKTSCEQPPSASLPFVPRTSWFPLINDPRNVLSKLYTIDKLGMSVFSTIPPCSILTVILHADVDTEVEVLNGIIVRVNERAISYSLCTDGPIDYRPTGLLLLRLWSTPCDVA